MISCKQYSVDKEVKKWIPYEKGQTLLFESSKGTVDTLKITKIELFNNPEDHLAIISPMHEKLVVNAEIPTDFVAPNGIHIRTIPHTILVIDANTTSTTIDLIYKPYDFYFESRGHNILNLKRSTMQIGQTTLNDIIVFNCNYLSFCNEEKAIKKIVWSDQYGIVKYKLNDEEFILKI
jgi:hypothetical protein